MRKILANPIQINSRLIHVNLGYYFLLDKSAPWLVRVPPMFGLENNPIMEPLKAGGLRTSGLATCVAIIVNTPTHIGLAHCDTFRVVSDLTDILKQDTLYLQCGDSVDIVFAYNPLFKRLENALDWQQGSETLAEKMGINMEIKFYAIANCFDIVGVSQEGIFIALPSATRDIQSSSLDIDSAISIPSTNHWISTRFNDYLINPRLRTEPIDYDNARTERINLMCLVMPATHNPADSEARLESQLHQWLRLIPTNTEAFLKILVPFIPLFTILILDNFSKTLSCAPRFVFPEKP